MKKQIEDEVLKCCDCDKEIELIDGDDSFQYDNKLYCEDCFNESFGMCERCNNTFPIDDLKEGVRRHRGLLCDDCFSEYFIVCEDCGATEHRNYASVNSNDEPVCETCGNNYFYCDHCNTTFHNDNYGEDGMCQECTDERIEENNPQSIHDYSYKPRPIFHSTKDEKKIDQYFGFELEVEGDRKFADEISEDFMYIKNDGSLSCGFEIVSHPLSFSWIKEHDEKLRNLLSKLRNAGMKSYNTSTCGIHWHVSKDAFSSLDIFKLLSFFYKNQTFILKISQRRIENLKQWASFDGSIHTCIQKAKYKNNDRRYEAINLQNEKTIEFRIFRGTLHGDSFYKNIEFVHSICQFVKLNGLKDVTVDNFKKYISDKKEYIHLHNFILAKGI